MSRAASIGFDHEAASASAPVSEETGRPQSAVNLAPPRQTSSESNLSILLMGSDRETAEATAALVQQIFGNRCSCDTIANAAESAEFMRQDKYDVYIFAEDPKTGDAAEFVRSSINSGYRRPIIVIAQNDNMDLDLRVLDAGAADCIPKDEMTPPMLERSIRHALLREHNIKRARREIDQLSSEIARLNTLRDANHRFVDNACHDFRSPLTVIKEFSSIISDGLAGEVNEEQSEFLEIILTRVDQLSHMVDSILDASRLESDLISVHREEHTPAELIRQAQPTLEQLAAGRGTEIKFAVSEDLPNVFADADSVGRIVVNLVTNACKFAGEGGKVEVWARHDAEAGAVTIGVTDNGPGIAPEHVTLIFERFRQIDRDNEVQKAGFGLGLHIASELARVNFGTLSVESTPQKGSTFAFTLPVFDVDRLIPLHFGFLKTSRHNFQNVSIGVAATGRQSEAETLAEVERFLNRQLRSYDLLLRLRPANWLACIACDEDDLSTITQRIHNAYAEHRRNRPGGTLPEIGFRPIGTWMLSKRPEGLSEAIRSAYALDGEEREVH